MTADSQPKPQTEDDIVAGPQQTGSQLIVAPRPADKDETQLLGFEPFRSTIDFLAWRNPKFFGGDIGAPLLSGWAKSITEQATQLKQENDQLRKQIDSLRNSLEKEKINHTKTNGELRAEKGAKGYRNLISVGGTAVFAFAVHLFTSGNNGLAIGLAMLGVMLIAGSWVIKSPKE